MNSKFLIASIAATTLLCGVSGIATEFVEDQMAVMEMDVATEDRLHDLMTVRGLDRPAFDSLHAEGNLRQRRAYERKDIGKFTTSFGATMYAHKNICGNPSNVRVVAETPEEFQTWRSCCPDMAVASTTAAEVTPGTCSDTGVEESCQALLGNKDYKTELWMLEDMEALGLSFLEGSSYWWNTHQRSEQFGHIVNRVMNLFHLKNDEAFMEGEGGSFDHLVSTRMVWPKKTAHGRNMIEAVSGDIFEDSWWRKNEQLQQTLGSKDQVDWVCMRRAIEVDWGIAERTFWNKEQQTTWLEFANNYFEDAPSTAGDANCAPPIVKVLYRVEGSGNRLTQNYDALERALARQGITDYENVTVSSATSSEGQIGAFRDFGLMFSPHSSQLKNSIFIEKIAAIVEMRGTYPGYILESPFSMGPDKQDVIYEESESHLPDFDTCPEAHGCTSQKQYKTDIYLIDERLDAILNGVLDKLRSQCPEWAAKYPSASDTPALAVPTPYDPTTIVPVSCTDTSPSCGTWDELNKVCSVYEDWASRFCGAFCKFQC
eukprot:Awhi_evm1s4510